MAVNTDKRSSRSLQLEIAIDRGLYGTTDTEDYLALFKLLMTF